MPYALRKSPGHEAYWVVNTETGKKHSIKPLPYSRARAQMSALYAVENGYILDRSKRRSRKSKSRKSRRVRGGQNMTVGQNMTESHEQHVFEGGENRELAGGKHKRRMYTDKVDGSKNLIIYFAANTTVPKPPSRKWRRIGSGCEINSKKKEPCDVHYVLPKSKSKVRGGENITGGKSKSKKKTPKRWVGKVTAKLQHPGSLSHKAARAGMDTHDFACSVLKSPSRHSDQTRRQAQFFVNINKHNKC